MINVLIVEDSRVIRDYLVHVLQTDPEIRVIGTAADGEQALEHVSRQPPDVILMDIHLPGIDGFETTRRIMSSNPIPIVVCTSSLNFDEVDTAMRALEAGALAALKKPRGFGDAAAEADIAAIINTLKLMSEIKVIRRWNLTAPAASRVSLNRRRFDDIQSYRSGCFDGSDRRVNRRSAGYRTNTIRIDAGFCFACSDRAAHFPGFYRWFRRVASYDLPSDGSCRTWRGNAVARACLYRT